MTIPTEDSVAPVLGARDTVSADAGPAPVVGVVERVGYAAGDAASVLFFRTFASYLMFFCTDVVGLAAGAIGTMLWVTRVFDALLDPLMGMVCDRTKSRHGRFRPWLRWMALPLAVSAVATFAVPDWSPGGKLAYLYVMYTLMMIFYTGINIPYGALMGVMTPNSSERTTLASFRFYGAYAADFVVKSSILYLVVVLGGAGDGKTATQSGYVWTMAIYAAVAVALFYFTFASTRERVEPPKGQDIDVRRDVTELLHNRPWVLVIAFGITTILWIAIRDAAVLYYVRYFVVGDVGEGGRFAVVASQLVTLGQVGALIGVGLTGVFTRLFGGKKNAFIGLTLIIAVLGSSYYFVEPGHIILVFSIQFATHLLMGPLMPLFWAMIADTADYSEWKQGRRLTGLIFSAGTFSQKLGWALGPALAGYLLVYYDYQPNVAQAPHTIEGLRMMMSWLPSVVGLASALLAMAYGIDRQVERRMEQELASRHANGSSAG
jgi:GPH family glycoside/pentoside/hexuronide:cation symporter